MGLTLNSIFVCIKELNIYRERVCPKSLPVQFCMNVPLTVIGAFNLL